MFKKIWLLCLTVVAAATLHAQTPVINAKKRTSGISINGNPNENSWEFTGSLGKRIVGTSNNVVSYAVVWDSLNLYLAVKVTDANKYNESANGWDDDALEVYIDAENNGGTAYGVNDRQFVKEWNSSALWEKTNKTTGVQHAWSNISGGYAIEMLIPWSTIGITNPKVGFRIGFDLANDDDDNGGIRETQLMWAGDADNWQYPQNFGDLVLSGTDLVAPTQPTNLVASAVSQSALSLNWTAATDNVGVAGYDVYRNGTKINTSLVAATTYNVTSLNAATAYQFYVQAKDAAGNSSPNSNTVNITTPDTQAPTAPANLAASGITQTSIALSWSASADNVAVTGYDVYRDGVKLNATAITATTYNAIGLTTGTSYSFYVQARDAAGNNTNSSPLNVTTAPPPDSEAPSTPANLAVSGNVHTSVTLVWDASTDNIGVSGYDLYQNNIKVNPTLIAGTSYTAGNLAALTQYSFYVVAKDAGGNSSANSDIVNITTPDTQAPSAPANLAAQNVTATSATLTWTASSDNVAVTGYDVYQDGIKINEAPLTENTLTVSNLSEGTTYSFFIKAMDAAGNTSSNSNALNVLTLDVQAPTAPAGLATSNLTATSVLLNWTASSDNVGVAGYDVYKNGIKANASPITSTSYNATGLTPLTAYSFYVQARDAAGNLARDVKLATVLPVTLFHLA